MYGKFHHYLIRLYNLHKKVSFKEFSRLGLSSGQPKMLEWLLGADGCAQKDIAEACELQPATISSLLNKMEKDGLVTRTPENLENGTHITRIFLTEKGRTLAEKIIDKVDNIENKCFEGFSEKDRTECLKYMERIYNNLKK